MNHSLRMLTACCAVLALGIVANHANAQNQAAQTPLAANLFYNYYTQGANQVNAQMYLAPRPVPAYVGHSYYTYQPLMPHEHMYSHVRNYYNWYAGPETQYNQWCNGRQPGGALNKTTVVWSSSKNHIGPLASSLAPFGRLHYRAAQHWYCPDTARKALNPRGSNLKGLLHSHGGCIGGNCGGGCADGSCGGAVTGGGCASGNCAAAPQTGLRTK